MTTDRRLRFEDYEADLAAGALWRGGQRIKLQDLPFRLLAIFLQRPGEVISRAELGRLLWPDGTFVDFEAGLNTAIAKLREALDDSTEVPRYIETVPKRGYRFVGRMATAATRPAAEPGSKWRIPKWFSVTALVALALAFVTAWYVYSSPSTVRIAVVKFDNETGAADLDRFAQNLTDSTVLSLGGNRRLAVIGNAAVLRTDRPFRDLVAIRDAVHADFIVIGQVQDKADGRRVMAHLIRAADQAHVWVHATPLPPGGETATEAAVISSIAAAVGEAIKGV